MIPTLHVCPIVAVEIFGPGEGGAADLTAVWLMVGVTGRTVILQVVSAEERLAAQLTAIGSFSRVVPHVTVPVRFGREGFAAVVAQVALMLLVAMGLDALKTVELRIT